MPTILTPAATGGGGGASVSDTAYDATAWNGVAGVAPSKNAVRDKIETLAGGGVLAFAELSTGTLTTISTTSTTPTALHATALDCVFTAPASGKVVHIMSAANYMGGAAWGGLCLLNPTTEVTGSRQMTAYGPTQPSRCHYRWVETGLTPGTSYTRRPAHLVDSVSQFNVEHGSTRGPVHYSVEAA